MHAAVIMHRNHVAVVMHPRCRGHSRCAGGDAGEHRSGEAERYDGWKDGSPDAHDSSKATLGPRLSARLGSHGTFAASGELLPLLAKAMPFGQK